jgi:hypothetical protein
VTFATKLLRQVEALERQAGHRDWRIRESESLAKRRRRLMTSTRCRKSRVPARYSQPFTKMVNALSTPRYFY